MAGGYLRFVKTYAYQRNQISQQSHNIVKASEPDHNHLCIDQTSH